jgi:beta-glucosidase
MQAGINHIMNDLAAPYIKVIKEASPLSLMASYAAVDQIPMAANEYLLQDILRDTVGFDGLIMSDAGAIVDLYSQHKIADSSSAAALLALEAGLQQELSPGSIGSFSNLLSKENSTSVVKLVDKAVLQILKIKFATGQFDLPLPTLENLQTTVRSEKHLEIARNMSRESIVLLQNNGLLPLASNSTSTLNATRMAVLGPLATVVDAGSYAANNYTHPSSAFLASIENRLGVENVDYVQGVDFVDLNGTTDIEKAVAAAKSAGLAILTVGSLSLNTEFALSAKRTDGEFYSHAHLGLPGRQQELVNAVLDTGVPTIIILSGGQAFALNNSTLRASAIIHTFLAGEFTGDAVVDILFADVNPSGKLTVSLPQADGAFPVYYDYLPSDNEGGLTPGLTAWQLPVLQKASPMAFGYGLSYTLFSIDSPTATVQGHVANGSVTITTQLRNTGNVVGKEVVQLYFRPLCCRIKEVPVKKLIRFEKFELGPGASTNVSFTVPTEELGYFVNTRWRVGPGVYTFWVGNSSLDGSLKAVNVTVV